MNISKLPITSKMCRTYKYILQSVFVCVCTQTINPCFPLWFTHCFSLQNLLSSLPGCVPVKHTSLTGVIAHISTAALLGEQDGFFIFYYNHPSITKQRRNPFGQPSSDLPLLSLHPFPYVSLHVFLFPLTSSFFLLLLGELATVHLHVIRHVIMTLDTST